MSIIDSPRRCLRRKRFGSEQTWDPVSSSGEEDDSSSSMDFENDCTSICSIFNRNGNGNVNVHSSESILTWIERDAPQDIIPKILSFAGPKKVQVLSKLNKTWRDMCLDDAVFKTMSEELGKWDDTTCSSDSNEMQMDCDDNHNMNWREFYCNNPAVPADYPTIPDAIAAVCEKDNHNGKDFYTCSRNVRILLQPQFHTLDAQIIVETIGDATFSVETLQQKRPNFPTSIPSSSVRSCEDDRPSSSRTRKSSGTSILERLSCRSSASAEDVSVASFGVGPHRYTQDEATIVLKTKKTNTPIFHIRKGQMRLSKLSLIHNCPGTDIWNGNSAVQIQPRLNQSTDSTSQNEDSRPPCAIIEKSKIMSISGRGIVAIDGSAAQIRNCLVYGCAATGVYIGGNGSVANMTNSDVVENGMGNKTSRRGIGRGHSGIYLEQGTASLINCNVSYNSLTGISAVSPTNAFLKVQDSDLVGNGSDQLDFPPNGSVSFRNSTSINNNVTNVETARAKSGLRLDEDEEMYEESGFLLLESQHLF